MPDVTGRIRAKALDTTGITESLLEHDWAGGAGRSRMAVVELRTVEPHGPNLDGKKRIDYVIEGIEPVPEKHEDRIREFQRGLFLSRPETQDGQPTLDGDAHQQLASAAQGIDAAIEHGPDGQVTGVWDGTDGLDGDQRPWPGDDQPAAVEQPQDDPVPAP